MHEAITVGWQCCSKMTTALLRVRTVVILRSFVGSAKWTTTSGMTRKSVYVLEDVLNFLVWSRRTDRVAMSTVIFGRQRSGAA
jgi:hypothetical protein